MRSFYLIGNPLSHSFSAAYFLDKFKKENIKDACYHNYPIIDIGSIRAWALSDPNLVGFNVTIPYKQTIIPFLDYLSPEAHKIGAVNTVICHARKLMGYNTDVIGFKSALPIMPNIKKKALILGTGGASKAIAYVFKQMEIEVLFVSRNPENSFTLGYEQITQSLMESVEYVVNTTPLGTSPFIDTFPPFPFEFFNNTHVAFDLVYNPIETVFMQMAKAQGAMVCNGSKMLIEQAEASWQIWNN